MADVFISYSRRDTEFVQVLHEALKASHYDTWIDWQDIAPTTEWWKEIEAGIETAHTFIFVISKGSVESQYCRKEVDHALQHGKRLIPVLRSRDFERSDLHPKLRQHQWLSFQSENDFDEAFGKLVTAIETDIENEKKRTRLENKAIEWEQSQKDSSLLLRGSELKQVEKWLQKLEKRPNSLTPLQEEFVRASQEEERNQKKIELSLRNITPQEYRNRQALLTKVNNFWVKGVLENSLHGRAMIELGLDPSSDAITRPWNITLTTQSEIEHSIPRGTEIIELFNQLGTGRSLLILGEPGSGKTTTLLALAKDLIGRAEQDIDQPMPVVLNLSSWISKKQAIADWLIEELNEKYQIPFKIGDAWVNEQKLLLLLDGLDEVRVEERDKCVQKLNQFSQNFGTEIVVCSRTADYGQLAKKLEFQAAISIQPLNFYQIEQYLQKVSDKTAIVRTIIREDPILREMAHSPLILSIMTLAYQEVEIANLPKGDLNASRQHLFDTYINRMLGKQTASYPYSKQKVLYWLQVLSKQMISESQTVFLIEHMQPTWLTTRFQRSLYVITLGVSLAIALNFIFQSMAGVFLDLIDLHVGYLFSVPVSIVLGLFWAIGSLIFQDNLVKSRNRLVLGLLSGIFVVIYSMLYSGSLSAGSLLSGLSYGIFVVMVSAFLSYMIHPAESLAWSWLDAKKGLFNGLRWGIWVGLTFGVLMGVIDNVLLSQVTGVASFGSAHILVEASPLEFADILKYGWPLITIYGLVFALLFEFFGGIVGGLIGGYSARSVKTSARPNQGIWQSSQNTLIFAILGAVCTGVLFGLLGVPVIPSTLFGLVFGIVTAGVPCLQHIFLRAILTIWGKTPWNYAGFLDFSSRHILLQKVGGGYIFVHRLLLEHFATMNINSRTS
jgi:eukaryotic-like serine/threonine-protein kinase